MRKLMLASAAILGATSGIASAQQPVPAGANMMMQPSQGQMALPWTQGPAANNNNNGYGQPNTYVGQAANPKNAVPTPGTVVIRLNGKVEVDMMASWSPNNETLGAKTNPISFASYMRLYPGVDGMAANGLRYGASIELRQNFPGGPGSSTPALSPAPSPSSYSSGQTVYVRRAFTYLASDNVGIVRFGQTDGVVGLFDPGIFYSSGYDAGLGNINGGPLLAVGVTAAAVPYVFMAQSGNEYANNKIVYLTPQFYGFDFGVQYAPNMGNSFSSCATVTQASLCNNATTGTDATRWYNQVGVGARWQGSIGPVALGAFGFYETAGKESFFGPSVGAGRGVTGNKFDNLSFYQAAGYATFDTGVGQLTWAVDYIGGATNGAVTMRPTGGAVENAITTGLVYRNGPITLGAQYEVIETQGSASLTGVSQRHEYAFLFGGNYNIAPGVYLVGEYAYTNRHQGGFDFTTGANGAGQTGIGTANYKAGITRDAHSNGVVFSTVVTW